MDPLQNLWDLYEGLVAQKKPSITPETSAAIGSPNEGNFDHPVIKMRRQVDDARAGGMDPGQAHEQGHGEVNLADVTMKSDLASTFGRVQDDGNRANVRIEDDAPKPSIMAVDARLEKEMMRGADNMKTPIDVETPHQPEQQQQQPVGMPEEYDYNEDIMYLQTYGRA